MMKVHKKIKKRKKPTIIELLTRWGKEDNEHIQIYRQNKTLRIGV